MAFTALNVVTNALIEMTVIGPGETPTAGDADYVLGKLNRLLDRWDADRQAVYADTFTDYTLTPSLSPHTIGPSGTFVVTKRPVDLIDARLILTTSTPNVLTPIHVRDKQWYQAQAVPALSTMFPTDVYYEPAWPNGKLWFWGVPSSAYKVRLWTRVVLGTLLLTDAFSFPQGYEDATTLSLAEDCLTTYPVPSETAARIVSAAGMARGIVFANNRPTPRLPTRDAGMPRGQRGKTFIPETRQL